MPLGVRKWTASPPEAVLCASAFRAVEFMLCPDEKSQQVDGQTYLLSAEGLLKTSSFFLHKPVEFLLLTVPLCAVIIPAELNIRVCLQRELL